MSDYWAMRREEEDGEFWRNPEDIDIDEWDGVPWEDPVLFAEAPTPLDESVPYGVAAFRGIMWGCLLTFGAFLCVSAAILILAMLLN